MFLFCAQQTIFLTAHAHLCFSQFFSRFFDDPNLIVQSWLVKFTRVYIYILIWPRFSSNFYPVWKLSSIDQSVASLHRHFIFRPRFLVKRTLNSVFLLLWRKSMDRLFSLVFKKFLSIFQTLVYTWNISYKTILIFLIHR